MDPTTCILFTVLLLAILLGMVADKWRKSAIYDLIESMSKDAVIMAADLALGRDVEVPPTAQFGAK